MTKLINILSLFALLLLFSCNLNYAKNNKEVTSLNKIDSVLWKRICLKPDSVYLHLNGVEMLISGELNDEYFSPRKISGHTDTFSFFIDDLSGIWKKNIIYYFVFYEDINFDGFKDLGILYSYGATGNYWYKFWLYNKEENNLIFDNYYSNIPSPIIDTVNNILQTYYRTGYCEEYIYILKNNIDVKRIYTERENTADGSNCWCIVQEKADSIWKETERRIIYQPLDRIYRNKTTVICGELK